jgi:hypothetical protein
MLFPIEQRHLLPRTSTLVFTGQNLPDLLRDAANVIEENDIVPLSFSVVSDWEQRGAIGKMNMTFPVWTILITTTDNTDGLKQFYLPRFPYFEELEDEFEEDDDDAGDDGDDGIPVDEQ